MTEAQWRGALAATLQTAQSFTGNDNAVLLVLFGELLSSVLASAVEPGHTESAIDRITATIAAQTRHKQKLLALYSLQPGGSPARH
jgi:hypothetical protein